LRKLLDDYNKHKPKAITWTDETSSIFERVKEEINKCQVLHFVNEHAPVYLHTDASDYGIGAYLFQVVDGKEQPIMYMSKTLSITEWKWHTMEKECYAIVYAINKFRHLLRDIHFTVRTDHDNLTYLKENKSQKVQRWKDDLQEYNFDLEHIPGEQNVVADAFSRLLPLTSEQINMLEEELNIIVEHTIIPADKYKIISKVHNSAVGHHGSERTFAKLRAAGHEWQNMRLHTKQFIKQCPCCQKMSTIKLPIETLRFTTTTYEPMQRINIDTINLNQPDDRGNKHIIVMIDCFSRWVELYPISDLTAKVAAQALLSFVGRYGTPAEIQSDQGTQYVNELISELTNLMGLDHLLSISPYSKEENGLVERANKEVLRHLRAIVFDKRIVSTWADNLPLVQRIMNTSIHEGIGTTPYHILFGNLNTPENKIFIPVNEPESVVTLKKRAHTSSEEASSSHHWLLARLQAQQAIIETASKYQLERDNKHHQSTAAKLTSHKIDDYVLVEYPPTNLKSGPPSKLLTNLRGPMKVISKDKTGSHYTLRDLVTLKDETVHVKRIHPFYYDSVITDPNQIAYADKQVYEIEKITDHKGNKNKPSSMEFKVYWKGYEEPSWEPYTNLRNTEALHKYLNEHKMKSLIPTQFKNTKANT